MLSPLDPFFLPRPVYDFIVVGFFCLATSALSKRKTIAPYFQMITSRHKWEWQNFEKPLMSFADFSESEPCIERMRVCNDTSNAYIHIMHTLQCNPWCWLLRKHCLPIIGVKYITWNYFMDAKQNEEEKTLKQNSVARFNLGFIR